MRTMLENIFTNIYALTGLNVFAYDQTLGYIDNYHNSKENAIYAELPIEAVASTLSLKDVHREILDSASQIYLYGIKSNSSIIFLGPVAHHILSPWEIHHYKENYKNTAGSLTSCSESSTYAVISLLISSISKKVVSISELTRHFSDQETAIATEANFIDQQLAKIDTFQLNHTIQTESNFFALVSKGDVDGMQKLLSNTTFLYPTPVKSHMKNYEYMAVSLISLLSRAAIAGSAPTSIALAQSDAYLKLISECHSEKEITAIAHDAAITFTKMVSHNQSMGSHSFTSVQCKKLIHAGLFNRITLSSLANELSVSKEYLATCFKNDYGVTVTHYINEKKSELACKILTNSDYSVNEIASYLCFNSVSYFIKVFKEYVGITPSEYRKSSLITNPKSN